jgi:hypothetical protein
VSGYTPVFGSVFTGTLCGKWPDTGVWVCLLALADRHGVIDTTPQYLSAVIGVSVEDLMGCLTRFMEPDPRSRSQENDGRRLVLVDASRDWGWRIVNHGKYRERARKHAWDSARTESGRDAERKRASRDVPTRPDASRLSPLSNTDTDSNKEEVHSARERELDGRAQALISEAEHHVMFERVQKAYPAFAGRQNWLMAEHYCRVRIEEGSTWSELLDGVKRYAAYVKAGGVSSTAHVMTPGNFFSAADKPWKQPFELPKPITGDANGAGKQRGQPRPSAIERVRAATAHMVTDDSGPRAAGVVVDG